MNNNRIISLAAMFAVFLAGIVSGAFGVDAAGPPRLVKDAYPDLTLGALRSARLVTLPKGLLLRAGSLKLAQKDLDADIAKAPEAVKPQLKRNLFFVLEGRAMKPMLLVEAKAWAGKQGRDPKEDDDALLRALFADLTKNLSISDVEMRTFYDENKDRLGPMTYDQVKDDIKEYLLNQKRQEFVNSYIDGISDRAVVEVDQAWVARQYSAALLNSVDKARKSGGPLMVDFSSDNCPPCRKMAPILEQLKTDYSGKVTLLIIDVDKDPALGARYGASQIPVQCFYDKDGKEFFRHVGFFSRDKIVAKLAEMGIK